MPDPRACTVPAQCMGPLAEGATGPGPHSGLPHWLDHGPGSLHPEAG